MTEKEAFTVSGRTFPLRNPEKVFFPEDGITKRQVVDYYTLVAPAALPHFLGRPVSMLRFPDGIHGESFFQKEASAYFPAWVKRVSLPKTGGATDYVVCRSAADLAYLAGQACITPHLWLSRYDRPDHPDLLIFDLDPPGMDFSPVRETALKLKHLLSEMGLVPFVKTTGSRGVHVTCPLDRSASFTESRAFAEAVGRLLTAQDPAELTVDIRKEKRGARVFIDWLRNSYGATAVAPYALRAKPGAPVAAPITWEELARPSLNSQSYNLSNIFRRLQQAADPWADMIRAARPLRVAEERLKAYTGAPAQTVDT
jgi:bifunctional non-homologous end joining protein LigD